MFVNYSYPQRTDLSDAPGRDNQGNVFTADVEYSSSSDQNDTAIITGLSEFTITITNFASVLGHPLLLDNTVSVQTRKIIVFFLHFFTEHGRIFIGTINPYSAKSIIHSRSFKRPKLHSVFTSWLDHSDFYTG